MTSSLDLHLQFRFPFCPLYFTSYSLLRFFYSFTASIFRSITWPVQRSSATCTHNAARLRRQSSVD